MAWLSPGVPGSSVTLLGSVLECTEGSFGLAACSAGNGGSGGGGVRNVARDAAAGAEDLGRTAAEGILGWFAGVAIRSWEAAELGGETMAVISFGIGVRWMTTGVIFPLAACGWRFDQFLSSSITSGSAGRLKMSRLPSDWMANGTVAGVEIRSEGT
jgi:hypothetical protein